MSWSLSILKKLSKTVVFFGSGPVAAKSLQLLADDFEIEAIITKPRPLNHRGDVPVITVANNLEIPFYTASNKDEVDALFLGASFKSELAILIDFGIIVSRDVIDYFPLGIVNSHFSILPEWRGADPITFAILSGQKTTGVSLMLVVEKMDEGPLLAYGEYGLTDDITTPELTDELIKLSHALLLQEIPRRKDPTPGSPQSTTGRKISYSRKLTKADGVIDWQKSAVDIEREIRAFSGWPGSRTLLADKDVMLIEAHVVPTSGKPGEIFASKTSLVVSTGKDGLAIDRLKPSGKPEMDVKSFLAGYGRLL